MVIPVTQARDRVLLHAFFTVGDYWKLTTKQRMAILGVGPDAKSTFLIYLAGRIAGQSGHPPHLSEDQIDRIGYLLGIYEAATFLTPMDHGLTAVSHPNPRPPFLGQSPLDHLTQGHLKDLRDTRGYFDGAMAGGWG